VSDFDTYLDDKIVVPVAEVINDMRNVYRNKFNQQPEVKHNVINTPVEEKIEQKKGKPAGQTAWESVLQEDEVGDQGNPAMNEESTAHEEHIFSHLFNLGVRYNKHLTFIMLSFGVVLALLFPQRTKSIVDKTTSKINAFVAKIKEKLHLLKTNNIQLIFRK